jgi:hypothetical protein
MIMSDEFKRLQELAGIKEMRISNPVPVSLETIKEGDKLRVKNTVYQVDNKIRSTSGREITVGSKYVPREQAPPDTPPYVNEGDIYIVRGVSKIIPLYNMLECIQGKYLEDQIPTWPAVKLINQGIFTYENR